MATLRDATHATRPAGHDELMAVIGQVADALHRIHPKQPDADTIIALADIEGYLRTLIDDPDVTMAGVAVRHFKTYRPGCCRTENGVLTHQADDPEHGVTALLDADLERMVTAVVDPALTHEERQATIRRLSAERRALNEGQVA